MAATRYSEKGGFYGLSVALSQVMFSAPPLAISFRPGVRSSRILHDLCF